MRIAILGAGFTGLAAGYELTKRGYAVTIFEKEALPGGLASGFKPQGWKWPLERAYHHLFTSDWAARNLLTQIGMADRLFFKRPITASLYTTQPEAGNLKVEARKETRSLKLDNSSFKHPVSKFRNPASSFQPPASRIQIYQLDSPLSLLKFPLLPLSDRIWTGIILAYLKFTPFWQDFERTTIKDWLIHYMGKKSWKVLWEPILVGKFGRYINDVNMAWFWARIKKRSPSLGYIQGGFQTFAETIAEKITSQGGTIHYNSAIKQIWREKNWRIELESGIRNQELGSMNNELGKKDNNRPRNSSFNLQASSFDTILSTLPTPLLIKVTPQLPPDFKKRLEAIPHLHALVLILELKKPFFLSISSKNDQRPYWINIMDTTWPFVGLFEHTNYISPSYYGGKHILYIGNYLPREHEFFTKTKDELLKIFLPYLKKINPDVETSITNTFHFVGPFAQPVIEINYSKKKPPIKTPLSGLYMGNLDSVYPWDRGTNYAIELGQKAAMEIDRQARKV